jgi:Tfp pilus assembly protein PilO
VSNLTERQLLVVTIAVSVLLTGGLLYFVFDDRTEIAGMEDEISALDARLTVAEMEKRKIPGLEDKILQFRAVEDIELGVLPSKQRISDFHRNISTFLSAAGISFLRLPESSPEDSELAKGIRVTRNRIKARGEAAEILKFMNLIENDPRLVSIKGFKIDGGTPSRDDPEAAIRHDFELALETYFYGGQSNIKHEHIPGADRARGAALTAGRAATSQPAEELVEGRADPIRLVVGGNHDREVGGALVAGGHSGRLAVVSSLLDGSLVPYGPHPFAPRCPRGPPVLALSYHRGAAGRVARVSNTWPSPSCCSRSHSPRAS